MEKIGAQCPMEKHVLNWQPEAFWDNNFLDTLEPWIRENWSRLSFVLVPKYLVVFERPRSSALLSYAKEIQEGYWLIEGRKNPETLQDEVLAFLQFSSYSALWLIFRDAEILNSFRRLYYASADTGHCECDREAAQLLKLTESIAVFTSGDESTDGYLYLRSAGEGIAELNQIISQCETTVSPVAHRRKLISTCTLIFILLFGGSAAQIGLWKTSNHGYIWALFNSPVLWIVYFAIALAAANGIETYLKRRDNRKQS